MVLHKGSLENRVFPSFLFLLTCVNRKTKSLIAFFRLVGKLGWNPIVKLREKLVCQNADFGILWLKQPRVFMASRDRSREIVEEIEKMGFNPSRMTDCSSHKEMTKSTREKKVGVHKKLGLD